MAPKIPLYPLKFQPILKPKVWGGTKLKQLFEKTGDGNIGESWEISGVDENISEISNGTLKGKTLDWLLENYKGELVGEKIYSEFGNKFPLLFKFIDAQEDLSVQVHPDDLMARKMHDSLGKTEMWYILNVDKDARIILDFNENVDRKVYLKSLSQKRITEILKSHPVKNGDAFLLMPGTVHAIGAGIILAEIQQTSDITYRIYDWDRPDTDGQLRVLHTGLALQAINFNPRNAKVEYNEKENSIIHICTTNFFAVNKLVLSKNFNRDFLGIDSFKVYMCVEGSASIETKGFSEEIKKGETILIPAGFSQLKFTSNSASFLEVFIP